MWNILPRDIHRKDIRVSRFAFGWLATNSRVPAVWVTYDRLLSAGSVSYLRPTPKCRPCEVFFTYPRVPVMRITYERIPSEYMVQGSSSEASIRLRADDSALLAPTFVPLWQNHNNWDMVSSRSLMNQTCESVLSRTPPFVWTYRNVCTQVSRTSDFKFHSSGTIIR